MDWELFKNIDFDIWYYGNKRLHVDKINGNHIRMSNKDIIEIIGNDLYFNDILISNIPDLTEKEIYDMYISYLKNKGYKFLNG